MTKQGLQCGISSANEPQDQLVSLEARQEAQEEKESLNLSTKMRDSPPDTR